MTLPDLTDFSWWTVFVFFFIFVFREAAKRFMVTPDKLQRSVNRTAAGCEIWLSWKSGKKENVLCTNHVGRTTNVWRKELLSDKNKLKFLGIFSKAVCVGKLQFHISSNTTSPWFNMVVAALWCGDFFSPSETWNGFGIGKTDYEKYSLWIIIHCNSVIIHNK